MAATSRLADALRFAPGEYPLYLTFAAAAVYGCVPETDHVPVIGVFVVGLGVVELAARATVTPIAHALAALVVLWSGLHGATGRDSAIIGTVFALWPIVLVVVARLLRPDLAIARRLTIGTIGGLGAIAVARTGALEPTPGPAWVAVAIAATATTVAAGAIVSVGRRPGR